MLEFDPDRHLYYLDGAEIPSVTRILEDLDLIPAYPDGYYRERGRAVHLACDLLDQGLLDEAQTDPQIVGFTVGYQQWVIDSGFKPVVSERIVHSLRHSFAGRMDRAGELGNDNVIVDLKSGDVPRSAALQTAGYAIAYEEETGIKCGLRVGLRLYPDGRYKATCWSDDSDRLTFLACVRVWRWKYGDKTKQAPGDQSLRQHPPSPI